MGFNSGFKGLICLLVNPGCYRDRAVGISRHNLFLLFFILFYFLWAWMKSEVYKRKVDTYD